MCTVTCPWYPPVPPSTSGTCHSPMSPPTCSRVRNSRPLRDRACSCACCSPHHTMTIVHYRHAGSVNAPPGLQVVECVDHHVESLKPPGAKPEPAPSMPKPTSQTWRERPAMMPHCLLFLKHAPVVRFDLDIWPYLHHCLLRHLCL